MLERERGGRGRERERERSTASMTPNAETHQTTSVDDTRNSSSHDKNHQNDTW